MRLTRRPFQRVHGRQQARDQVDVADRRLAGDGEIRQKAGKNHIREFGDEQKRASIARVGQHPPEQGEDNDRDNAHEAQRAQAQGLCAEIDRTAEDLHAIRLAAQQVIDVPVDGDELHLGADDGHEQPEPKDAVVTIA